MDMIPLNNVLKSLFEELKGLIKSDPGLIPPQRLQSIKEIVKYLKDKTQTPEEKELLVCVDYWLKRCIFKWEQISGQTLESIGTSQAIMVVGSAQLRTPGWPFEVNASDRRFLGSLRISSDK